jgi:hypothetical protein
MKTTARAKIICRDLFIVFAQKNSSTDYADYAEKTATVNGCVEGFRILLQVAVAVPS